MSIQQRERERRTRFGLLFIDEKQSNDDDDDDDYERQTWNPKIFSFKL